MGKVLAIATRIKPKAPMDELAEAPITFNNGVASDSRGKNRNHRQVTVLTEEGWKAACEDINADLPWTFRRANFLVNDLGLSESTGKYLKIGSAILRITGELHPCHRMDAQHAGLTDSLTPDWRGGVTCEIVQEGYVSKGDDVELLTEV